MNYAVQLGWETIPCHDVGSVSSSVGPETSAGHWVIDPGPHPVDAGRAAEANFEMIERALPPLQQDAQVILLSSAHVFSGDRVRMPGGAPRAPLSDHGRRLADLEDIVLADGGAILRLDRVLNAADPLMTRWRNRLKEGVPVGPFRQGRCAPLTTEAAVDALFDVLGAAPAVYQMSAPDEVSCLDIAQRLCAAMRLPEDRAAASPVTPSALELDDWPRYVSLEPTPSLLNEPVRSCDAAVGETIELLLG